MQNYIALNVDLSIYVGLYIHKKSFKEHNKNYTFMCIILFQFLKQQVEFVNENNISDMEQASMTNQDPGQRFRRIRQANQDVSRPSIVEPSLKEQVCSHFKILIFFYMYIPI